MLSVDVLVHNSKHSLKHRNIYWYDGAVPEVRYNNTEESVLYYVRKNHNKFTILQWILINAKK